MSLEEIANCKVKNYLSKNFARIKAEAKLSEALGKFSRGIDTLVVFHRNRYIGILTETIIVRSRLDPTKTKCKSLAVKAPKVFVDDNLAEVARLIIENDIKNLPVFKGKSLVGTISDKILLAAIAKGNVRETKAKDVMTAEPISITEDTPIRKALSIMRKKNLSHLPVVDEKNRLVGIVTMHDIVVKSIHPLDRAKRGEIIAEKIPELNTPIANIMSYPPVVISQEEYVGNAARKMIVEDISSLVVVNKRQKLKGIVTKKDLLQLLLKPLLKERHILFSYAKSGEIQHLSKIELKQIEDRFTKFANKLFANSSYVHCFIFIKKHKERHWKRALYHVRLRVVVDGKLLVAHSNGYGLLNAFLNTLSSLRKQLE
ncbi:MAG: CBS domain-containing protein [Candidatus Diapherotrites archaeon]|nr:CBS domain-containing protein [Candidatus Diapherotrites archaeon]